MQELMNSPDTILLTAMAVLVGIVLVGMVTISFAVKRGFLLIVEQIKQSIIPKYLTITAQTEDVADMAIELWRLEKRLAKTREKLTGDENKALSNSVDKIKRFVQKNDVEVADYSGQAYNEGMNLDILSSEKDPSLKQSIISETHEPAVIHKGILLRKAKVIIREK